MSDLAQAKGILLFFSYSSSSFDLFSSFGFVSCIKWIEKKPTHETKILTLILFYLGKCLSFLDSYEILYFSFIYLFYFNETPAKNVNAINFSCRLACTFCAAVYKSNSRSTHVYMHNQSSCILYNVCIYTGATNHQHQINEYSWHDFPRSLSLSSHIICWVYTLFGFLIVATTFFRVRIKIISM